MLRVMMACVVFGAAAAFAQMSANPYATAKEGAPIFDGKDLSGWTSVLKCGESGKPLPADVWSVVDGEIRCTGEPFGYLQTQAVYKDFVLKLEYRWPGKPVNSGVFLFKGGADEDFLPTCVEVQLQHGNLGDMILLSKSTSQAHPENAKHIKIARPKGVPNVEKPAGEWNSLEITVRGQDISLSANGTKLNELKGVKLPPGFICLQSEGGVIAFRNITLAPL